MSAPKSFRWTANPAALSQPADGPHRSARRPAGGVAPPSWAIEEAESRPPGHRFGRAQAMICRSVASYASRRAHPTAGQAPTTSGRGGEDVKHFTTVSRAIRRKQPLLRNEHRRPLAWSLRTLAACDNCNLRQFPATNNARYSVAIRRDVPGSSGLPDCSPTSRCGADWWFPREMIRAA